MAIKTHFYAETKVETDMVGLVEVMDFGGTEFLYVPDMEHGGRVFNLSEVISIVPNYHEKGAMFFLKGCPKPVRCDPSVEEVASAMSNHALKAVG